MMNFRWLKNLAFFGVLSVATCLIGGVRREDTELDLVSSGSPPAPGTFDVGGTAIGINLDFGYLWVQTNKGCYQAIYYDASSSVVINGVAASVLNIPYGSRIRSSNSLATGKAISIDVRF